MRAPRIATTAAVITAIRDSVAGPGTDRYLSPEIDAVVALASSGALVAAAESVTGPLA
jgi:histidine ammonia-lyase